MKEIIVRLGKLFVFFKTEVDSKCLVLVSSSWLKSADVPKMKKL